MEKQKKMKTEEKNKLIVLIRISGMVKIKEKINHILDRLRLKKKYACVLINSDNKSLMGMLDKVKFNVAYGEIERDTLIKLIKARAKSMDGDKKPIKIDAEKVAEGLLEGKKLDEFKLKPFFRLHPPLKGINSKLQYPKGVLGNNKKDINKLV